MILLLLEVKVEKQLRSATAAHVPFFQFQHTTKMATLNNTNTGVPLGSKRAHDETSHTALAMRDRVLSCSNVAEFGKSEGQPAAKVQKQDAPTGDAPPCEDYVRGLLAFERGVEKARRGEHDVPTCDALPCEDYVRGLLAFERGVQKARRGELQVL